MFSSYVFNLKFSRIQEKVLALKNWIFLFKQKSSIFPVQTGEIRNFKRGGGGTFTVLIVEHHLTNVKEKGAIFNVSVMHEIVFMICIIE